MERFVSGDVVVINFPFSDLTGSKRRPALILKKIAGDDLVLCQITSQSFYKSEEIIIKEEDFFGGSLKRVSYVRFTKLFTAEESIIFYKLGKIKQEKLNEILDNFCKYIKTP